MPIDYNIWKQSFSEDSSPAWPCPHCQNGQLAPRKITFYDQENAQSRQLRHDPAWQSEWYRGHFSGLLVCQNIHCAEVVSVIGYSHQASSWNDEGEEESYSELFPQYFYPTLPVFSLPARLPARIGRQLQSAFALYWSEPALCRQRLKTSAELLLTHAGVPRYKNRASRRYSLKRRLQLWAEKNRAFAGLSALEQLSLPGVCGPDCLLQSMAAVAEIVKFMFEPPENP